jgi:putative transposase
LTHREWMKIHNDHEIDAPAKFWQRNYYEHIIRDDYDLYQCRKYIAENPAKWKLDPEYRAEK